MKPKNEFAFPQLEGERLKWWGHGMTLRDYMASKSLNALIISSGVMLRPVEAAKIAYTYADAMLAEREAKQ
jgi:hypothetical protein